MIDHISIRVSNLRKSTEFYKKALGAIGYKKLDEDFDGAVAFVFDDLEKTPGNIWIIQSNESDPPTKNVHIAFRVKNEEIVKKFYDAAMSAGGKDNGKPGRCPEYSDTYYGGFVLDLDGNNIEAKTG